MLLEIKLPPPPSLLLQINTKPKDGLSARAIPSKPDTALISPLSFHKTP